MPFPFRRSREGGHRRWGTKFPPQARGYRIAGGKAHIWYRLCRSDMSLDISSYNAISTMKTRIEILDQARASRGPLSPVKAGQVKTQKALLWVYRWGWSTSKILEIVGGAQRSGLAARLVRSGHLKATKTEAGPAAGAPLAILTLTQQGQNEVEKFIENASDLIDYQLDPYRIDQSKIRHGGMAQKATANNLKDGGIADYVTEPMAAARSQKYVKQHDIIWICDDGKKIGVEVELSAKWNRKLDEFIHSCILSIHNKTVGSIFIATDSKAIQNRYETAFRPGNKFGKWEKSTLGFPKKIGTSEVPNFMDGKIFCVLID